MYEVSRRLENTVGKQQWEATAHMGCEEHAEVQDDKQRRHRGGRSREESKNRRRQPGREGRADEIHAETRAKEDEGNNMQHPKSPKLRRRNLDAPGGGGWNVIDSLIVVQCARMPVGMQTVEYVPNSLQEKWSQKIVKLTDGLLRYYKRIVISRPAQALKHILLFEYHDHVGHSNHRRVLSTLFKRYWWDKWLLIAKPTVKIVFYAIELNPIEEGLLVETFNHFNK